MSATKGLIGEGMISGMLARSAPAADARRWFELSAARIGGTGIDGLYVRVDDAGRIAMPNVVEAKFGTSRLAMTADGRQMSGAWSRARIARSARAYATAARAAAEGRVVEGGMKAAPRARVLPVPLRDHRSVRVELSPDGIVVPAGIDVRHLAAQLRRVAVVLQRAATGEGPYEARLLRLAVRDGAFKLELHRLDPASGARLALEGSSDQLASVERAALERAILATGVDPARARALVREVLRDPSVLDRIDLRRTRWWREGLDRGLAVSMAGAAAVAGAVALVGELRAGGTIDLRPIVRQGGVAAAGAGVGYLAARHTQSLLMTPIGRQLASAVTVRGVVGRSSAAIGGTVGGIASGLAVALGLYLGGAVDAREARVMASSSVLGALAALGAHSGAFALAAALGTAGTGTAIGSLSGAAFTSAALAWLGMGGGMAVGATILTGGVAAVGLAVSAGFSALVRHLDEGARVRLARLSLDVSAFHLARRMA